MKAKAKKVGAAVLAALSSPTAVTAEKSVGVLVATRVLLAVGASAGVVSVVEKIINGL